MKQKLLFLLATCLFVSMPCFAQMKWNEQYQRYINQYRNLAIQQMKRYRIPASIKLAQGLFESGAGKSQLAMRANNHFGIKCHGWNGRKTYHDDDEDQECFRAYNSVYESYEDHSKFLVEHSRYRRLFQLRITDYKGWAHGLKAAGYATNPSYAKKLIEVIELYQLYRYDTDGKFDGSVYDGSTYGKVDESTGLSYSIHLNNRSYYIIARRGDTFKSIAKEVGTSDRALARYNERDRKDILEEGDRVYLVKKRKKADKRYKNKLHVVRANESMYSIAQFYGIRMKSLYKKNNLDPEVYRIKVGDRLRVY